MKPTKNKHYQKKDSAEYFGKDTSASSKKSRKKPAIIAAGVIAAVLAVSVPVTMLSSNADGSKKPNYSSAVENNSASYKVLSGRPISSSGSAVGASSDSASAASGNTAASSNSASSKAKTDASKTSSKSSSKSSDKTSSVSSASKTSSSNTNKTSSSSSSSNASSAAKTIRPAQTTSASDDYTDYSDSYSASYSASAYGNGPLIQIANPDYSYSPKHLTLSAYDRNLVERMVMGEGGLMGFNGCALIAQCIHDAMVRANTTSMDYIISNYGYYGTTSYEPNQDVIDAVSFIFDQDRMAVQHRAMVFYTGQSAWHETQVFLTQIGTVRFFDLSVQ